MSNLIDRRTYHLEELVSFQDMKAIQLVWDITNEWNEAWQVYKTANFWEIEMEQMETTANVLFRKLNRLSRELKDKNWEIVEHSRYYRSIFFFFLRENNNFVSIIFRRSRNLRRGNNFFVSFLQNERGQVQAHPSIDHRSEKSGDEASPLAEGQGDRGSRFR